MNEEKSIELMEFYESLTEEQHEIIENRVRKIIEELKKNGISEWNLYMLRCQVAKDLFQRKLLND